MCVLHKDDGVCVRACVCVCVCLTSGVSIDNILRAQLSAGLQKVTHIYLGRLGPQVYNGVTRANL